MQRFVDVRSLVAIVTLAEELSFTRAAKRLGMSQSGLSRHISSLEHRHRVKLFERNHANVILTDAGRAFVEEAKLCLLHDERALQAARTTAEGVEHVLKIGRSPYADPFLTSALLSIRLPLYPNFRVNLHSDFAPELVHDLIVFKLDLALITNPGSNRKLTMTTVSEAPLYAVLPDSSPLLEREAVTLADLGDQTWILFEKKAHPIMYDTILRRAAEEGIAVKDGQKVLTAEDAAQLVSEHLGVAFVSMPGAMRIAQHGAHVRPIDDPALTLSVCLASRADNRSKSVSEFARAFMRRISQVRKPPQSEKGASPGNETIRIAG
jgi:DNA-binding transcriptional LysR family regulator